LRYAIPDGRATFHFISTVVLEQKQNPSWRISF